MQEALPFTLGMMKSVDAWAQGPVLDGAWRLFPVSHKFGCLISRKGAESFSIKSQVGHAYGLCILQ